MKLKKIVAGNFATEDVNCYNHGDSDIHDLQTRDVRVLLPAEVGGASHGSLYDLLGTHREHQP